MCRLGHTGNLRLLRTRVPKAPRLSSGDTRAPGGDDPCCIIIMVRLTSKTAAGI